VQTVDTEQKCLVLVYWYIFIYVVISISKNLVSSSNIFEMIAGPDIIRDRELKSRRGKG
jgi:hypothetical protein